MNQFNRGTESRMIRIPEVSSDDTARFRNIRLSVLNYGEKSYGGSLKR